ncbi:hypothetical protein HMI51_19550 [Corallococcus coralloides]|nr:hypothetical protein [Corallococcus coralloides]
MAPAVARTNAAAVALREGECQTHGPPSSVLFPTGSSGKPQGVRVSHQSVADFFCAMDARGGAAPVGTRLEVYRRACDGSVLELLWALLRGFRVQVRDAV